LIFKDVCAFVKSKIDQNNLESVYFAQNIASDLANCQIDVQNLQQLLQTASSSQNLLDLYYYTNLAKSANLPSMFLKRELRYFELLF
jgi:hypothetical protein